MFTKAFQGIPTFERKELDSLLQELIPGLSKLGLLSQPYSSPSNDDRLKNKRLSSRQYYWRYFTYGIRPEDVSDNFVASFVEAIPKENPTFIDDTLRPYFGEDDSRVDVLIEKLRTWEHVLAADTSAYLAQGLGKLSDVIPRLHPDEQAFPFGTRFELGRLIVNLCSNTIGEKSKSCDLLVGIIDTTPDPWFAVNLAEFAQSMFGKLESTDRLWFAESGTFKRQANRAAAARIIGEVEKEPLETLDPRNAQHMYSFWFIHQADSFGAYARQRVTDGIESAIAFLGGLLRANLQNDPNFSYYVQTNIPFYEMLDIFIDSEALAQDFSNAFPGLIVGEPKSQAEAVAKAFLDRHLRRPAKG
jgi:hypothetical protein